MSNISQQVWQQTPESLNLSPDHIDVWLCYLEDLSSDINEFYVLLSDNERDRADKLKIEGKQKQFVITRGYLRQRLGSLANIDPKDFVFEYLKHGKPILADKQKHADITFNVSHSHDLPGAETAYMLVRVVRDSLWQLPKAIHLICPGNTRFADGPMLCQTIMGDEKGFG